MRINRVLCFFKPLYDLKLYKSDQFQFLFSVGTKQGNDNNVNLYHTIRLPYFISLTLFRFHFYD